MRAGTYCEEDRPKNFLWVPNHRPAIRVGMLPGQLLPFNAFFNFCSKGRIPQEFFYYNMLHNPINNDNCCVPLQGGMETSLRTVAPSMSNI